MGILRVRLRVNPACHDPDFILAKGIIRWLWLCRVCSNIPKNHKRNTYVYRELNLSKQVKNNRYHYKQCESSMPWSLRVWDKLPWPVSIQLRISSDALNNSIQIQKNSNRSLHRYNCSKPKISKKSNRICSLNRMRQQF